LTTCHNQQKAQLLQWDVLAGGLLPLSAQNKFVLHETRTSDASLGPFQRPCKQRQLLRRHSCLKHSAFPSTERCTELIVKCVNMHRFHVQCLMLSFRCVLGRIDALGYSYDAVGVWGWSEKNNTIISLWPVHAYLVFSLCCVASCTVASVQKRHVAIARLRTPAYLGRTCQQVWFIILVVTSTKEVCLSVCLCLVITQVARWYSLRSPPKSRNM